LEHVWQDFGNYEQLDAKGNYSTACASIADSSYRSGLSSMGLRYPNDAVQIQRPYHVS